MPTPPIDGSLRSWHDVAEQHDWSALLLGNGLSINVWPGFAYGSLFDHARGRGLTDKDRELFDGTRNFERALSDLTTAMRVGRILHMDTGPILERYRSILDQFGQPIDGDSEARPLLVTEGSAVEKLRAIEGNDYLAHALQRLRDVDLPTVVFGSSLSAQDGHLVEALNEQPDRPVAISMRPGSKKELATRQAEIFGRLETESLVFFDATTHPLGAPSLGAP